MVNKWIILYGLMMLAGAVNAQEKTKIDLGLWTNCRLIALHSGIDPGVNGAGIALGLNSVVHKRFDFNISGELGAAGTGFYLAGNAGVGIEIPVSSSRFSYIPGVSLLQGAGLFRPELLYMWGIEQKNILAIRLKNESMPGLLFGWRYYGFPGYAAYSDIHRFMDLRIGLHYRF